MVWVKTIQNDDIEYYDGKIHSINNFTFEKNNYNEIRIVFEPELIRCFNILRN